MEDSQEVKIQEPEYYTLNVKIPMDSISQGDAQLLLDGIQGLVNSFGPAKCINLLLKIKQYPMEFQKAVKLVDDPAIISLIRNL